MNVIAVTGPRHLTLEQRQRAIANLKPLLTPDTWLHVGDATGLDALALALAGSGQVELHQKNPALPWKAQGAERSTRMIKALANGGGTLHAWPNKPAPAKLRPARTWPKYAEGSGTWGTIALAVGLGVTVELHPLNDLEPLPDWLAQPQQLQLV